ncbi:enoyl-CoA hydratase/isomerase family protein [Halomarina salina]|uniref:Enoyl-CoA hydratase/isomerase family protein n=1 Tax=Halomarina salina TaxID=1872699 RepID=A0ABD5RR78_9EURY
MDTDALSTDDLRIETGDDALVVRATIDRPDQRNALNESVVAGLLDALDAADDADARVFVIRGAGGTFCSGGDLSSMPIGGDAQEYRENFSGLARVLKRMKTASVVTVAAVEGYCLAGGCGLAAACEFVVADADAEFGTPEVSVGLFPAQAMAPITRAVGEKQALRLMFTGERIDAEEAKDVGLVTTVADEGAFDETLDDTVASVAQNSPVMLSMGKEAYYAQRDMGYGEALDYLKEVIALLAMSEDTEEGIDAFLTDREPEWRGR